MLGSAHPAHRAVALRRPATSAVLSAVLARTTLPPPSAPVARSPSAHHAPPPCASPSQFAHRAPPLGRSDRGGAGLDVCRGLPRPRLPLRSVIREGWLLPAAWRVGSESRWRGLVMGARVAESPGAGARAAVIGVSSGEGEERWRGEGVEVGGAEREVGGEGGASEQVVFDPPALPAAFEGVQQWVVFSDLHVSRRNAELCAALLTHVHQLAKDRAAGVVCLGDFWHVRGSLPVEALNAVMHAMGPAVWTQPTLMIPGNHDQVSVDGTQHALAVLERINPHIVVLSRPTVLLAALWLPFRHHAPLLSAAMHQALHAPPPSTPPIRAVFMHADVEGARRSSTEGAITLPGEGLDPLLLPPGVPVYSGHLHLPHTVAKGGHSVVYVGSCMQHSFGEAGQSKRAVVLRGGTWEHVEDIPLHVGPRHFIIPTTALASQPGEGEGESGWQAGEGWQQVVAQLRAGDLVRWEEPGGAAAKDTRDALASLRATGALVQTVASQALSRPPRILQADTLEPSRVFASYATAAHLPPPVLSAAQDLLKDLEVPPRLMHSTSAHVCLDAVHLSGFGPFLAPTTYPLAARGIVLLCGRNEVAGGAAGDSNGAGKTSLAMAALWALTGSMDARPESRQGLRMADVVHRSGQGEGEGEGEGGEGKGRGRRRKGEGSGAGVARVRVEGRVNGKAFVVEREASRWVEREACRWVGREASRWVGEDVPAVGVEVGGGGAGPDMPGDQTHAGEDRRPHAELSGVVGMDVWGAARARSKDAVRALQARVGEMRGGLAARREAVKKLERMVEDAEGAFNTWEAHRAARQQRVGVQQVGAEQQLASAWLREQQQRLGEFEAHVGGAVGGGEVLVCDRCQQPIDPLHAEECSRQLRAEVEETQRQLAGKQQAREVLQEELVGVRGWLEARQRERRKSEERDAQARRQQQQAAMAQQEELKAVQRYTAAASQALDSLLLFLHCHSARLPATPPLPPASTPTTGPGVDGECGGAWRQEVVAAVIREAATVVADAQAAEAEVERWRREAECGQAEGNPHDGERRRLVEMLGEARGEVEAVEGEVDAGEAQLGVMKQVDAAFGLAGVQSFVLEGALWELDAHVARYLAALSGGALLLHLSPTRAAATATKAARGKKTKKASGAGKSGVADSSTDSEASSDSGGSERGEGDEEGAAEEAGNGSGGEGQVLERIDKSVRVRLASGELVPRALRQLSGGERRRVALALALAFAELAAERSGVRYDLLVLDEVFQHLDDEGVAAVAAVRRSLPQRTVVVVSQANSREALAEFGVVDWVVKRNDVATVELAHM
ncbi:unnamed protein product [Closterium sp. NIES-64]|nr:unnamed protein product [Closterium sp. NIES-64]